MEGNTPLNSSGNFSAQGSPYPENEDLNDDNTLSDTESYYEYEIDLNPTELDVGRNNIVDKIIGGSLFLWVGRDRFAQFQKFV